jgi:predicted exporter
VAYFSQALVIPVAQATNLDRQQEAIDKIKSAYQSTDHSGTRLVLAGPVMIALSARAQIRNDVRTLSISATLIVIAFLYFAFRNLRIVLLSAVPLASGMLAGAVAVTLLFETVHGITIAFGATLIGIAVDYPMHFFNHLGAALTTRFLLPGVLPEKFKYKSVISGLKTVFKNYAHKAERLWPVLIMFILFSVVVLAVKSNLFGDGRNHIWNDNLYALSPASEQQLNLDKKLRHDLNLRHSNELILITAESQEAVLQSAELLVNKIDKLDNKTVLNSYEIVTKYLPSIKEQQRRLKLIPGENILRRNLKQASAGLPFRENLFEPFIRDVNVARKQPPVTIQSFSGTILADKISPLLFKSDNLWVTTLLLYDVKKPEVIKTLLKNKPGNQNWQYVVLSEQTKNTMAEYRQRALLVFSFGALAIICALWIGVGSLAKAVGIALVPFSVLLVDAAILSLFNIELTLFHLVAMLLVAGLGIDYALFFNRIRTDEKEWETSFPAIWKSWLTTVLVFGSLMFSDTAVLGALGQTVTLGVSLGFLFGLIVTRRFSSVAGSL